MSEEVIEADVVDEPGTEVVPANLFRTDDPAEVLRRANETANALMPVVRSKGLVVKIQGRDHLTVEAWQTLGAMMGVTPVCTWTRKLDDGWEARVEARTLDGRVIGAAESECLRSEEQWSATPKKGKARDDFALRSMAQTRATSKALASVLRFVATLAGASGTPAEEMPREGFTDKARFAKGSISDKQKNFLERLLKEAKASEQDRLLLLEWATSQLTGGQGGSASQAIDAAKEGQIDRLLVAAKKWQGENDPEAPDTSDLPVIDGDYEDQGTTI